MDMQMSSGTPQPERARDDALTFHGLHSRIQELSGQSIYAKAGQAEKWSFRIGIAAAAVGLICGLFLDRWIPERVLLLVALACLVVEIGGFILIFAMVMLYLVGWVLIAQRTRLDTYVSLLDASLQEPTK